MTAAALSTIAAATRSRSAGRRDQLIERFQDLFRQDIPGLEQCTIHTVPDAPHTIWMTQIWTTKAAHDAETHSPAVVAATAQVMSLLADPPEGSYGQVAYHRTA